MNPACGTGLIYVTRPEKIMEVSKILKEIFSSGNINADWENDEVGTMHQIQAQAEHLVSKSLSKGEISYLEATTTLKAIMEEYGYHYPLNLNC